MVRVRRTYYEWKDGCDVKDLVQIVLQRSHICKEVGHVHIFAKEWKEWVMQL